MRAPRAAGRQCHGAARRRPRRQGRHPGLERLPPPGALLRRLGHGRGAAHRQPEALHRADRLHRQPCRGPGAVRRPDLRAAAGRHRRPAGHGRACRGDDRRSTHAGDLARQRLLLRDPARRRERGLCVARLRRTGRVLALLHLGHDGQSQGRALQPPLDPAARHGRLPEQRHGTLRPRRDHADRADVSRQRVVAALSGLPHRRRHGAAGHADGRAEPA